MGWDTKGDRLHQIIYLGIPLTPDNSFLNDFAIDSYNNAVYIADTAAGENSALIVVDLDTGYSRRVLEGHASMRPEDIPMMVGGNEVTSYLRHG